MLIQLPNCRQWDLLPPWLMLAFAYRVEQATMHLGIDWEQVLNTTQERSHEIYAFIQEHVDLNYLQWLLWVIYPLILTIIMPFVLLGFYFGCALFLHLYKLRFQLIYGFRGSFHRCDFWDGARRILATAVDYLGWVWHGYEVVGIENIPETGPALLIYYHGCFPTDMLFLMAKSYLYKQRTIHSIGDKFLFTVRFIKLLMDVFNTIPGTVSRGVELMKDGHLLTIAPGGTREALFSSEYYELLWGNRTGFAKIATEAKVPIIPVFTQNWREAWRVPLISKTSLFRKLYEKTRLPLIPMYGGFPVKLRTFVGKPIPYDPDLTSEELAIKVQEALKGLIRQHQKVPGNILRALMERVYTHEKKYS